MISLHADRISPYIRYVNDLKRRGYCDFGERVIYDHELFFCVDGEAKMYMDDGVYTIKRGDIFFLRPNLNNRMVIEEDRYFHAHCVHFDWYFIGEKLNFTAEEAYIWPSGEPSAKERLNKLRERPTATVPELDFPALLSCQNYEQMLKLFRGMYNAYGGGTVADNLRLRGYFLQIIANMAENDGDESSSTAQSHREIVEKACAYIDSHYSEEITVPGLASKLGISGKYFGIIFKRIVGLSVTEYTAKARMARAEELLLKTTMTLSEIADDINVSDEFYLVKLFKKYKGVTPGRYRRMLIYEKLDEL